MISNGNTALRTVLALFTISLLSACADSDYDPCVHGYYTTGIMEAVISEAMLAIQCPDDASNTPAPKVEETRQEKIDALLAPAQQGEAEAQYRLALLNVSDTEKWKWFCLAGNQGHANALFHLGGLKYNGFNGGDRDLVESYKWYSLAALNGHETSLSGIADEMTPTQIAEAERLVAEWEPNPAECEIEAAQADS